jgi:hypothetical protein
VFNCKDIETRLLEVAEQAANNELPDAVRAHLDNCPDCASLVNTYAATFVQVSGSDEPVPDRVWRSLQQRIERFEESRKQSLFGWIFSGRPVLVSLRSATLALAAAIGIYLGSGLGNGQVTMAEQIADDYATLLADYPTGSLAESYLELELNGDEDGGAQ